jgi:Uma2 family endonuclease
MPDTGILEPPAVPARGEIGPYTVEDFYRLVPDGTKADLIDGYIYVSSPDSERNNDLNGFLAFVMRGYVEATGAGKVYLSRFAFRLAHRRAPEPDVAFVSAARLDTVASGGGTAAPDIAVEIVSEDSVERDYEAKFRLYEDTGVREYWIVDPLKGQALFYQLCGRRFALVEPAGGVFRSEALPGFWLRVDWLTATPLPGAYDCLQEILTSGRTGG